MKTLRSNEKSIIRSQRLMRNQTDGLFQFRKMEKILPDFSKRVLLRYNYG